MAVEIQSAPTLPEMAEAKDQHEMDSLKEFGKCAVGLRSVLYQDRALSEGEFHFMECSFYLACGWHSRLRLRQSSSSSIGPCSTFRR